MFSVLKVSNQNENVLNLNCGSEGSANQSENVLNLNCGSGRSTTTSEPAGTTARFPIGNPV